MVLNRRKSKFPLLDRHFHASTRTQHPSPVNDPGLIGDLATLARKHAKDDIARYIELFCSRRRIHSALGHLTPHEVGAEYMNSQLVA